MYQAIKKLLQLGLITERATERSSRGPQRTILAATPTGRRAIRSWLGEPVEHVREVRSLLLLKLALLDRIGDDPTELLGAQREVLKPKLEAMQHHRDHADGFELTLATWRLESIKAVLRFLDASQRPASTWVESTADAGGRSAATGQTTTGERVKQSRARAPARSPGAGPARFGLLAIRSDPSAPGEWPSGRWCEGVDGRTQVIPPPLRD